MDSTSPVAALLVGQPTLRRRMKLGILAALDQRIAVRYAMPPMSAAETGDYLKHHLGLAGRSDTLFSDDAATLIHQTSRGYPRAVNNLAVHALTATYAAGQDVGDRACARVMLEPQPIEAAVEGLGPPEELCEPEERADQRRSLPLRHVEIEEKPSCRMLLIRDPRSSAVPASPQGRRSPGSVERSVGLPSGVGRPMLV
jgi:hypothetical protein